MPCVDDRTWDQIFAARAEARRRDAIDELLALLEQVDRTDWRRISRAVPNDGSKAVLDFYTERLCSWFKRQTPEMIASTSTEARAWWVAHQEADRRREEREVAAAKQAAKSLAAERRRERLKKQGVAKLTPAERRALGV